MIFHGNPELQKLCAARGQIHFDQDMLIAGTYDNHEDSGSFRACHIGCHGKSAGLRLGDHKALADYYGLPKRLMRWSDRIFEQLSIKSAKEGAEFSRDLSLKLGSLPLSFDFTPVWHEIAAMRLHGLSEKAKSKEVKALLIKHVALHKSAAVGQIVDWKYTAKEAKLISKAAAATATATAYAYAAATATATATATAYAYADAYADADAAAYAAAYAEAYAEADAAAYAEADAYAYAERDLMFKLFDDAASKRE